MLPTMYSALMQQELSKKRSNMQTFVWSILYSFHLGVMNSCELRSIKYTIEKDMKFDLFRFFIRTKQIIATSVSIPPEELLLDSIRIPLKELMQVLRSIYQKGLVKKTHLLTLLQTRSKENYIMAADITAIVIVDFVKCRDKTIDNSPDHGLGKEKTRPSSSLKSASKNEFKKETKFGTTIENVKSPGKKKEFYQSKQASKSALKNKTIENNKNTGRSATPDRVLQTKVTFDKTGDTKTQQQSRSPLRSLTPNLENVKTFDTAYKKPRTGGLTVSKQIRSVFLEPEITKEQAEMNDAIKVKKEFEYHLTESIPKFEEYKKRKMDEERRKRMSNLFKDKDALMYFSSNS